MWLVASTTLREYVTAIWGWDEDYQIQRFRGNFGAAPWQVIVVDDKDAGGFQSGPPPSNDMLFLANIYLLPQYQRRGIGSKIIRDLIAQAGETDVPLKLNVLKSNPDALRLYERLGLAITGENDERYFMSTKPSPLFVITAANE